MWRCLSTWLCLGGFGSKLQGLAVSPRRLLSNGRVFGPVHSGRVDVDSQDLALPNASRRKGTLPMLDSEWRGTTLALKWGE